MNNTLYIDGQWVPALEGCTRTITYPADGTVVAVVAVVAEATGQDTERAIAAARGAADDERWASVPAPERGSFLLRERSEKFALAESKDTGKRINESRQDMSDIANCFEYFGKIAAVDAVRIVDAGDPDVLSRVVH